MREALGQVRRWTKVETVSCGSAPGKAHSHKAGAESLHRGVHYLHAWINNSVPTDSYAGAGVDADSEAYPMATVSPEADTDRVHVVELTITFLSITRRRMTWGGEFVAFCIALPTP